MEKNNNELDGLSVEQINSFFEDIVEFGSGSIIASVSCKQATGDNCAAGTAHS